MRFIRWFRSPMVARALLLVATFGVLHLLGGRQYVGVLSGTMDGGMAAMLFGVAYALSWFGAVLLAPILLLAGLASASLRRRPPTPSR
ncbi:hypothetical protein LY474_35060 [Myxococcus stipitatus]|uniref:hypothetical protein n=1 Tax=Myxococcus stipitatus TaxID=83455 RepID=UPI001F487B08|nr:hypothetical protein [Myxococcus stipitatus]MCE9673039.1 hypothetical protein [Myxococcus stipitatus]